MDIDRALDEMRAKSIAERLDPDNPECPGCGRRAAPESFSYLVTLVVGDEFRQSMVCAECADDADTGMSVEDYRLDLLENWQPIAHHAVSKLYRGLPLPEGFYDGMEFE